MIEFKTAAQIAAQYLQDLFSEVNITEILLEEVEHIDNDERYGPCWYITLSYATNVKQQASIPSLTFPQLFKNRTFKTFIIDDEGNVRAMKIRELQS